MTGYSEFIEKYHDIIPIFQAQGFRVVMPEWRAWFVWWAIET